MKGMGFVGVCASGGEGRPLISMCWLTVDFVEGLWVVFWIGCLL